MNKPNHLTITELPKTKKTAVDQLNTLQKVQKNKFTLDQEQKLQEIGMIYGGAMAMMVKYQRQILAEPERMPGLRSSFLSLQSNLGRLNKIQFEDVFNRSPILQGPNAHQLYLRQFN